MSALQVVKLWLIDTLGLAKDALHIYVALVVLFGAALLFRWRIGGWKPLAVVLAAAVAGEVWDIRDVIVAGQPVALADNWHDIWNTMLWPLAITALARWTAIFGRAPTPDDASADEFEQPLE